MTPDFGSKIGSKEPKNRLKLFIEIGSNNPSIHSNFVFHLIQQANFRSTINRTSSLEYLQNVSALSDFKFRTLIGHYIAYITGCQDKDLQQRISVIDLLLSDIEKNEEFNSIYINLQC